MLNLLLLAAALILAGDAELPVDRHATPETRALYHNLIKLSGKGVLFGQQDALAYGVGRAHPDSDFCDVKDVCGSYPAVYGWDIGNISGSVNVDKVRFDKIKRLIREGHARGGIITVSWHEGNPATGGGVNDTRPCGAQLLPGGKAHAELVRRLTLVGTFFRELKDKAGRPIPVIFRPYHEHNGDWFWWGTKGCTEEEYRALFRFTVSFLRDSLQIHQLLYAISPDKSRMNPADLERGMLYAWPGDDCVDIFGLDNYWDVGHVADYDPSVSRARQDTLFVESLRTLIELAARRNKIPA
ncbi:MAG TPA: glycosyl hydrolase, partial [bacterium]|nr:glycosyl hydrolase [bacterium]